MSSHIHRKLAEDWVLKGRRAMIVEVIKTAGSVPRHVGTRMLVAEHQAVGTIGGGHLELEAIELARELLADGTRSHTAHYPLGPSLGQCCGGAVTLGFEWLDGEMVETWPETPPLFHLQLYGAGHVGTAIARILSTIDCRVDWIDERDDMFPMSLFDTAAWPDNIRIVAVDAVESEVAEAPPGAYYLVLTHSHDLDLRITEAILRRGDFGYLGLIGSETKRARFIHRFEERGIAPERIARMTCPIGLEGIWGKEPEIIAVSVVAQLLQDDDE